MLNNVIEVLHPSEAHPVLRERERWKTKKAHQLTRKVSKVNEQF